MRRRRRKGAKREVISKEVEDRRKAKRKIEMECCSGEKWREEERKTKVE